MVTSETYETKMANRIQAACELARINKHRLSELTAIPYSTLHRKLKRPMLLTVDELISIADTLGYPVEALLPDDVEAA